MKRLLINKTYLDADKVQLDIFSKHQKSKEGCHIATKDMEDDSQKLTDDINKLFKAMGWRKYLK